MIIKEDKMREKQKQPASFQPDRILSYFKAEWQVLLAVTISGLIYNVGLLAGPWFEGKMTGCLVDILSIFFHFSFFSTNLAITSNGMAT